MRKKHRYFAFILALLMVAAMAMTAVAASTSSDSTSTTNTKPMRGMRMMAGWEQITKLLGLSADEIKTERQAGKSLAQIAESKNVTQETLISTIMTANKDKLDSLLASSKITQAKYDECLAAMKSRITEQVTSTQTGPPQGKGGKFRGHGLQINTLDVVSKLTGLTAADIRTQLKAGKTLTQVAESKNVTQDALVSALVTEAKKNLDTLKSDGKITQEQYDSRITNLQSQITKMVTSTCPAPGQGGKFNRGRFHGTNLGTTATTTS